MNKKVAFIVPNLIEGSGGIRTIINYMNYLIEKDYECHAYVEGKSNIFHLIEEAENYFGVNEIIFHSGWKVDEPFDLVVATIWYSAKIVADLPFNCHKAYLIQDFEALFNPMGDAFLLAENSYQYGLYHLTLGRWLPTILNEKFSVYSRYFDFGADKNIYYKDDSVKKEELSIAFIFQPEKPRRCYQIGLSALKILKSELPDIKIYLYGSNEKVDIPFEHINLGILKLHEIRKLYNQCSVGLCISSSNPSRVPFEMMACGLPVVDVYMNNNLYDFPEQGVLLAQPFPNSIAKALKMILLDNNLRRDMSNGGINFMLYRDMKSEFEKFAEAVDSIFNNDFNNHTVGKMPILYKKNPII
ncbi:rhamnosyltransferase WsaF family glycosyltransferase [Rosettibacter primus]|uniref:rhamnosyltransferase WsaF family glycosyltransferase n=1 Tax=Rosettibacter primus TaxID=3111523 RepID=UPI00336BF520